MQKVWFACQHVSFEKINNNTSTLMLTDRDSMSYNNQ